MIEPLLRAILILLACEQEGGLDFTAITVVFGRDAPTAKSVRGSVAIMSIV